MAMATSSRRHLRVPLQGGVLVAQKDFYAPKHSELEQIPNRHVIKMMQSLKL
ncbi:40S ribosomal protein S10 [Culex quinquefasciatus]|uniref:40S ribosomal protein S10 n=1 Tax=Culex quinquefasciatus TaxID=7176 RepID=B0WLR4_CULQU|nr:40S ribosomal protein S10 [Culex quinquefasciatus]|eukprot:XP_001849648.1 40S ribosomal protein S10 [Culex quinquefasciatus]